MIKKNIEEHKQIIDGLYSQEENINEAVERICACFYKKGCLLLMGNGGSFADALHIEGELVGKFKLNRKPLPVKALGTGGAVLTAISNDFSYKDAFAREVEAYAQKGDVLFGLSTSGNSENILTAFEKGREIKTYNILLTGKSGGKISEKGLADLVINVDSDNTPRIQEAHELIYHTICEEIENLLFNV
ncbi:MAG: SIS domain-containing protein [archaeon]|nr:SIS domain-containing protein [archaeon]